MQKHGKKTPEEIVKDLEEIVLPEISDDDLEDALGGILEEYSNLNCGCGC